jgi:protein-S-isoprenylcysteine O-methyltransferase Ste14
VEARPSAPDTRAAIWFRVGTNLALAAVWTLFAYQTLSDIIRTDNRTQIFPLLRNTLLALLFLNRRPAERVSSHPIEWVVAIIGTFIGFAYITPPPTEWPFWWKVIAVAIMGIGPATAVLAVASLGRSFGIVPADRGIRTSGLYRIVRHPIYGAYIVSDVAFLMRTFCWHNVGIFVVFVLSQALRAVYEERFLAQNPAYRAYQERVRYRFIPGLY